MEDRRGVSGDVGVVVVVVLPCSPKSLWGNEPTAKKVLGFAPSVHRSPKLLSRS